MTALAQGSSVTLTVVATDSVLIDSAAGAKAVIEAASGVAGSSNKLVLATHPGGQATYGPFGAGTVKLSAIGGALTYEQGSAPLSDDGTDVKLSADGASLVSGDRNVLEFSLGLAPVSTPVGFRWTGHGLTLRRTASGEVQTDWLITDLIPTPSVTYYVDPLTGSDSDSGLTAELALANLATALAKADVDQIIITGLTSDYIALGTKGWNNTQPTRSVSVLNRTGYRYISCDASATLPTWTVNGTYSNVYQSSAISAANGRSVTDMSTSAYVTYVDKYGVTQTLSNQPKRFRTLKRVASVALVAAEAGTYFHDGTYLQVRPHDDRVLTGTTTMLATTDSNNGRMPSVSSATIYVEGVDFVGGNRGFLALTADTVTGHTLAFNHCSFQGTGVSSGLVVEASAAVRLYRCGAYDNFLDGFNYHAAGNDAVTEADAPTVIEVECVAIGNGTTGSTGTSDNASTAHEYTEVISLNCVFVNSDDAPIADINNAHRWMIGSHLGPALVTGSGRQNVKVTNTAKTWLDGCYAEQGANERWMSETSTSILYHFNSGAVANASAGAGVVRAYLG